MTLEPTDLADAQRSQEANGDTRAYCRMYVSADGGSDQPETPDAPRCWLLPGHQGRCQPKPDPEWDAQASARFEAAFDARYAELVVHLRALAERDGPVCIMTPTDTDARTAEILTRIERDLPGVILVNEPRPLPKDPPMFHPSAALAMMSALALGSHVPPMPGERDLFRVPTKAPKPPPEVQDAIKAAAEDRRDRKRVRNLVNIGHDRNCAMDMAMGHAACWCGAR